MSQRRLGACRLQRGRTFVARRALFGARIGEVRSCHAAPLAQLVERQSHNLKVASSSLAGSNSLLFVSLPLSLAFCLSHTLLTSAMRHLYKMVCINSATV